MFKLGLPELIVIFLAVVLLFGPKALPDFARALARAVKNFQKAMQDAAKEVDDPETKDGTNS